ncbi:AAA family ATPase [Streptomyces sp. NBC_00566]|uniref:AAA family ATPase n=1 Tax=Streptomyces sp. NBC_00566 TaxID=2975778 RepID=UPI002E8109E4|nr:AAA family ATPase [Streptomyces sp. NBC_00566]WUB88874.1 AAA family ATPase [Streptomyces sp. NBC_00566]
MASLIRIKNVTIRTSTHQAVYPFDGPLTFITGSIGVGKSSLLELLKYGLGGSAKLMPAIKANVQIVEVNADFAGRSYRFIREMGDTKVDVLDVDSGEIVGPWSVTNRKYMPKVSQQLLAILGLPGDLRIPRRRVKPTSDTVGVSFFDLYHYIYLGQNEIDTSVVGHADRNLDNKRRAVFELLYGLNSPELVSLSVRKGEWLDREKSLRSGAAAVKDFLLKANEPDMDRLQRMEREANEQLDTARELLNIVRNDSESLILAQRALRDRVSSLRAELTELSAGADAVDADIYKSQALLAQLNLEQQALSRADVARHALSGLEFSVCPRCMQDVTRRTVPSDCCTVCLQHEERVEQDFGGEAKRLASQIAETKKLLSEDEREVEVRRAAKRVVETALAEATMELDRSTAELITPRLEEVQSLSMQIARLEAQLEQLQASSGRWSNYKLSLEEADEARRKAGELDSREQELQEELAANRVRLDELAEVFDATVRSLRLPWYQSADIDRDTYLPVVNNEQFDDLSVGGARKTIVNLAYHLANLQYALESDLAYPGLLIVDSPRKNVGQTAEDSAVAEEVYKSFGRLVEEFGEQIQLIVADNSIPEFAAENYPELHFSYDNPVVPGAPHPGEGVERLQ